MEYKPTHLSKQEPSVGFALEDDHDFTLETDSFQFGRYEVTGEIGRGGSGAVYRAWDCQLQRFAALKVMLSGTWNSPTQVERFLREARATARLNAPGTVRVFDVGTTTEGAVWFAMELIDGPSLAEKISRGLKLEEALSLFRSIATSLQRVHDAGMAHRDIKPSNILLNRGEEPLLTDFGLVVEVANQTGNAQEAVGTPAYMAPEQSRPDATIDWFRADIYALGAMLYEMISGRQPPPFWHLKDRPLPPMGAKISPDLQAICQKAMSWSPSDRYPDVRAMVADLDRLQQGFPVAARPASALWRSRLFLLRHRATLQTVLLTVASVCALSAICGAAYLHYISP